MPEVTPEDMPENMPEDEDFRCCCRNCGKQKPSIQPQGF
jgi:hypothetical protein